MQKQSQVTTHVAVDPEIFTDVLLLAFRTVSGTTACKNELAIKITLNDLVGAQDADGILEAVEPGDLGKDGAALVNLEARKNFADKLRFELAILVREGIDGRVK